MKPLQLAAALCVAAFPAFAADVGVSVSIGQPGFYGRLDIGDFPPPRLIYRQPIVIERGAVGHPPVYLRVPPGHAKNWRKHCHAYNACGERVYFVQDSWYRDEYVPRYQQRNGPRPEDRGDGRRDEHRAGPQERGGDHGDRGNNKGRDRGHGR